MHTCSSRCSLCKAAVYIVSVHAHTCRLDVRIGDVKKGSRQQVTGRCTWYKAMSFKIALLRIRGHSCAGMLPTSNGAPNTSTGMRSSTVTLRH